MIQSFTVADVDSTSKIAIVHTNLVAPLIIKNCKEEYQHVSDFDGPLVYGRLTQNVAEHPLVQVQGLRHTWLDTI
jgi:hypothetical protein